jgi:hypothetical protein
MVQTKVSLKSIVLVPGLPRVVYAANDNAVPPTPGAVKVAA